MEMDKTLKEDENESSETASKILNISEEFLTNKEETDTSTPEDPPVDAISEEVQAVLREFELTPDIQHDQLTIQDNHDIDRLASPNPPDEVVASNKNRLNIPDSVIEGESTCNEDKKTEEKKDETKDIVEPLPEKINVIKEDRPKLGDETMSLDESSADIVLFDEATGILSSSSDLFEEDEDSDF
ncbi:uncharacterized protein LOC123293190 [Chrysoperla carnea]|uniref:uncharacterized protein LOC123293190 n=1 Tax=Chrysoperla carnea TaxID=189513 RepID=UPI001D08DAEF|nr:uncharacterized protein LOC123293190 [Chrysoperla carnea]